MSVSCPKCERRILSSPDLPRTQSEDGKQFGLYYLTKDLETFVQCPYDDCKHEFRLQ